MILELEIEEVGSILNLLNETPTKMGYYPICVKIATQLNAESAKAPAVEEVLPDEVIEQAR